jgi:hypothetical protein
MEFYFWRSSSLFDKQVTDSEPRQAERRQSPAPAILGLVRFLARIAAERDYRRQNPGPTDDNKDPPSCPS